MIVVASLYLHYVVDLYFAGVLGGEGSRLCLVGAAGTDPESLKSAEVCIQMINYYTLFPSLSYF